MQRRQEDGQEARLQQQAVPLKAHEIAPDDHKRQVEQPERRQTRRRSESGDQQNRGSRAGGAQEIKETIRGIEPTERWQQIKSFRTDALLVALLFHRRHELAGRQNAIMSDESIDLGPERDESEEIHEAQRPQKKPAHEKIRGRFHVPPPAPTRERREQRAVSCHEAVSPFTERREQRERLVHSRQPSPV